MKHSRCVRASKAKIRRGRDSTAADHPIPKADAHAGAASKATRWCSSRRAAACFEWSQPRKEPTTKTDLAPVIEEANDLSQPLGAVWTDGLPAYQGIDHNHRTVIHDDGYVSEKGVHTDQPECLWSLLQPWLEKFHGPSEQAVRTYGFLIVEPRRRTHPRLSIPPSSPCSATLPKSNSALHVELGA